LGHPIKNPLDVSANNVPRFTMIRELGVLPRDSTMPFGYRVEPWYPPMLPAYAAVMAASFANTPEEVNFPDLGSKFGCSDILQKIADMPTFLSGASWLVLFNKEPAAIVISSRIVGAKQGEVLLLAVTPRHRGVEVGKNLLIKALWAFKDHHMTHAVVKVSQSNRRYTRFLRRAGFHMQQAGK